MSIVSAELVAVIARKLVQKYAADGKVPELGNLLLGPTKMADGLTKLIEEHKLDLGAVTEASEFVPALLDNVLEQLKRIQGEANLKPDGVFGERTLHWLENRLFGHYEPSRKESLPKSTSSTTPGDGLHALRFFVVDDKLPAVGSLSEIQVFKLLREAWGSWVKICNIDAKETGDRADANVIINMKLLAQPASVVAIADVGPPGNRQLELSFDTAETWTPHKFQATAAHEIGHLLGIHHINAARQLMNDTLHEDIKTPQDRDKAEAVRIWGART